MRKSVHKKNSNIVTPFVNRPGLRIDAINNIPACVEHNNFITNPKQKMATKKEGGGKTSGYKSATAGGTAGEGSKSTSGGRSVGGKPSGGDKGSTGGKAS